MAEEPDFSWLEDEEAEAQQVPTETKQKKQKERLELKPYQVEGVKFLNDLCDRGEGGILADQMGLGKTGQMLRMIESQVAKKPATKALVMMPPGLIKNWQAETRKFTDLEFVVHHDKERLPLDVSHETVTAPITFTSYQTLNLLFTLFDNKRQATLREFAYDKSEEAGKEFDDKLEADRTKNQALYDYFFSYHWPILVFDEAHNGCGKYVCTAGWSKKNLTACTVGSVKAKVKFAISGTIMPNNLGELVSIAMLVSEQTDDPAGQIEFWLKPEILKRTKRKEKFSKDDFCVTSPAALHWLRTHKIERTRKELGLRPDLEVVRKFPLLQQSVAHFVVETIIRQELDESYIASKDMSLSKAERAAAASNILETSRRLNISCFSLFLVHRYYRKGGPFDPLWQCYEDFFGKEYMRVRTDKEEKAYRKRRAKDYRNGTPPSKEERGIDCGTAAGKAERAAKKAKALETILASDRKLAYAYEMVKGVASSKKRSDAMLFFTHSIFELNFFEDFLLRTGVISNYFIRITGEQKVAEKQAAADRINSLNEEGPCPPGHLRVCGVHTKAGGVGLNLKVPKVLKGTDWNFDTGEQAAARAVRVDTPHKLIEIHSPMIAPTENPDHPRQMRKNVPSDRAFLTQSYYKASLGSGILKSSDTALEIHHHIERIPDVTRIGVYLQNWASVSQRIDPMEYMNLWLQNAGLAAAPKEAKKSGEVFKPRTFDITAPPPAKKPLSSKRPRDEDEEDEEDEDSDLIVFSPPPREHTTTEPRPKPKLDASPKLVPLSRPKPPKLPRSPPMIEMKAPRPVKPKLPLIPTELPPRPALSVAQSSHPTNRGFSATLTTTPAPARAKPSLTAATPSSKPFTPSSAPKSRLNVPKVSITSPERYAPTDVLESLIVD